jgi:hypothetical protein
VDSDTDTGSDGDQNEDSETETEDQDDAVINTTAGCGCRQVGETRTQAGLFAVLLWI